MDLSISHEQLLDDHLEENMFFFPGTVNWWMLLLTSWSDGFGDGP